MQQCGGFELTFKKGGALEAAAEVAKEIIRKTAKENYWIEGIKMQDSMQSIAVDEDIFEESPELVQTEYVLKNGDFLCAE